MSQTTTTNLWLHLEHNEALNKLLQLREVENKLYSELMRTPLGIQYMKAKANTFECENELCKIDERLIQEQEKAK
jgi:hypothetical protein